MASNYVTNDNTFTVTGNTTLNNDSIVNIGNSTATFGGTVNADANTADGQETLTIINSGNAIFNGAVGNLQALGSLSTPTGTTTINGGQVTTTGAQTYGGDVMLGAGTTLTSTGGGTISVGGDVNAATAGGQSLAVTTSGAITFAGSIGNTSALSSIATMSDTTFTTSGSSVTTTGDQNYNGPTSGDNLTLGAGGNINANDAGNDFTGTLNASGVNVTLQDANALTANVNASQSATLTAASLTVSGSTGTTLTTSSIGGTTTFGTTNVGTDLSVTSSGGVSQTGPLDVNGTTSIQAGANPITLTDSGNDFTGSVSLTGGAVEITDQNALTFGTVNATSVIAVSTGALDLGTMTTTGGGLTATSNGGNIVQSGTAVINGPTNLNAGAGQILLQVPLNDFIGRIDANGTEIRIFDQNDMIIGTINAGSGIVQLVAGADMSGAVPGPSLITAGSAILTSTGGADTQVTGIAINIAGLMTLDGTASLYNFSGGSAGSFGRTSTDIGVQVNGVTFLANLVQIQAGNVIGSVAGAAAAVIVDEANRTFGTDSVAEDVEYGFAGEIGSTPPMDHRIDDSGISLPRCVQESRDGVPCK
jgi:hypothetical protein